MPVLNRALLNSLRYYFAQGVVFKEGQTPTSVLTLAAEDSNSHIEVMRELVTLLADPKNIEASLNLRMQMKRIAI